MEFLKTSLCVAGVVIALIGYQAYRDSKIAAASAAFDQPRAETPFEENAANLAEKASPLTPHPGLFVYAAPGEPSTVRSTMLLTEKGTLRTELVIKDKTGEKELARKELTATYQVKGHTLVLSEMKGALGMVPSTGRIALQSWTPERLVFWSETSKEGTAFVRQPDPQFAPSAEGSKP